MVPRYGKLAHTKVKRTMHELKEGRLRSSSGQKVKSRKQAIAIGLSEARAAGGKAPAPRKKSRKKSKKKVAKKAAQKAGRKKKAKA